MLAAEPAYDLAPFESSVADGMVMAHAAIRLALRNQLVRSALGEKQDFDRAALQRAARSEIERLAVENENTAAQLQPRLAQLPEPAGFNAVDQVHLAAHRRRPEVHRALAAALRSAVEDQQTIDALVDQAESDAAADLQRAVVGRVEIRSSNLEGRARRTQLRRLRRELRKLNRAAPPDGGDSR